MDFSEQIRGYERELGINRSIIDQEYWHIGTAVHENPELVSDLNKTGQKTFDRLMEAARNESREKAELIENIGQIENRVHAIDDLKGRIENRTAEVARLQDEMKEILRESGEKAFELYAASPQTYLPLADTFSDLDKTYREQDSVESRMDNLQKKTESDPIFKRLINQTKLQFQRNQLKGLNKKIGDGFERVARELIEKSVPGADENAALEKLLEPAKNQQGKIDEIAKIITKHRDETATLQTELDSLSGNRKPEESITDFQLRISERDEELRRALTETGLLIADAMKASPPEPLKVYFDNLQQLIEENRSKEEKVQRLQAAQKIQALEEEKARFRLKEEKLERQLKDVEEQLKRVRETIGGLDDDIVAQGKIRGKQEDLF